MLCEEYTQSNKTTYFVMEKVVCNKGYHSIGKK